ncbi:hypothetical protein [Phenylobacterium sp.]|uniref:hypothetical protein n=1 Tax=Phenylobacterium sp. TaxID=1871053 RepID=UPI0025E665D1|nr:hypothetical protein [Phenylobacterium sp.]
MATLFAPPELFSAFSCVSDGSDPDLAKGTHLRVFAGMGASFPLAPFVVFKIAARQAEPHALHVTDRAGKPAGGLFLSQLGIADVIPMLGDTSTSQTVRLDLRPSADGGLSRAQLFDQSGRLVAERDSPPFLFSAPRLHRLRLRGSAAFINITSKTVDVADIVEFPGLLALHRPGRLLGLPVQGRHAWYVGVQTRQDGLDRVAAGAPLRLNPMDRPDGPLDAVSPEAEVARVQALLQAAPFDGGLEGLLSKLIDDGATPPWLQIEKQRMPTGGARIDQLAETPRLAALQLAAIDPGMSRFLGFADHIDDLPDLRGGGGWDALAVAGLFAIDPTRFDPNGLLGLEDPDPNEGGLFQAILRQLAVKGGDDAVRELRELVAVTRARGLLLRAMIAVTAPTPPALAPSLPEPLLTEHRWQTAVGDMPSSRYRASFAFHDAPLAGMAAMAARIDDEMVSRHAFLPVGDFPVPERATPRIFGREQSALASSRRLKRLSASGHRAGLLADQDLPAEAGPLGYRWRASDLFGRFGEPAESDIGPPPRPPPPPPVLRFHIERAAVDPASPDPLSPGALRLTFAVPQPLPADRFNPGDRDRLASAMIVPAIGDLAAGSMPVAQATIGLDGESQDVDLTVVGFTTVDMPLPALAPQETRTLTLSVTFTDADGVVSAPATRPVKVTDMRPPRVIETGVGLFWTTAPGPSPDVELRLAWPAAVNSLHRVYVTDQQGLGLTAAELAEAVPGAAPSRGRVAEIGCNKVLGGAPVDRANFRLLTTKPVQAGADGRAILQTTLPRSLQVVQFLRVVPLSAEGAEAPFDGCGVVPVAVPDSRRPAPPRLEGGVDPATGIATLSVVAASFDGIGLQRDEPGLFADPVGDAQPPEFRLRRAVGAVADPIYGRPVAAGLLDRDAAAAPDVRFTGAVTDDNLGRGLEPFVRYVYWADVRLPPERRLPVGVVPIDPPGGVTALDPGNAANQARPMSLPSPPRVLVHVPADPPAALAEAAITATRAAPDGAGAVEVSLAIADPPMAHPKAIGPYRLAVWTQWPGQSITPIAFANGEDLAGGWPDLSDGFLSVTVAAPAAPGNAAADPITLRFAVVDPTGRMGDMTPPILVA